jgi:hypothetical protein
MSNGKLKVTLHNKIIFEAPEGEEYYIEQDFENKRFYVTSKHGYNGYEADGDKTITSAINKVNKMIKQYYFDRCLENPKN